MVSTNDLALTIAEFAHATPTYVPDGRSLVPVMQNPNTYPWRKQLLIEHFRAEWQSEVNSVFDYDTAAAVRTGDLSSDPHVKYAEHYAGMQYHNGYYLTEPPLNELKRPTTPPDGESIWNGQKNAVELYRLESDPLELNNSLYQFWSLPTPERVNTLLLLNRMKNRLDGLLGCVGQGCRSGEDAN